MLSSFVGDSRDFDRASKSQEKLTEENSFLDLGGERHVLGLGGGHSDIVLKLVDPRDKAAKHDVDVHH